MGALRSIMSNIIIINLLFCWTRLDLWNDEVLEIISYQAIAISLCCGYLENLCTFFVKVGATSRVVFSGGRFLFIHLTMLDHCIRLWDTGSIPLSLTLVVLGIVFFQLTNLSLLSLVSWTWILSAMYLIYCCWIYPFYFSPLRKILTVPCNPLWGHFFVIIREEAGVPHRSWHQQYGNLIRFFLPFGIEVISVADEEALKQITVKDPYNFPYPPRLYIPLCSILGKGLLVAQGEAHALQRKTLAPAFSNASIKSLSPVFWRKALLFTRIWRQQFVSQGKRYRSIDVFEWSRRTTLDVIGEAAFGANIDSLRSPEAPLHRAFQLATSTESNLLQVLRGLFRFLRYIPMRITSDAKHSRQIIITEAAHILDCKLKPKSNAPDEKDIMSLIMKTNQSMESPDSQMTLATLKDQVRTFLGAGHDTTSTAVAWSLLLLTQNPDIQTKLREEIREHMPSLSNPTSRDIAGQEEIFRSRPPALPRLGHPRLPPFHSSHSCHRLPNMLSNSPRVLPYPAWHLHLDPHQRHQPSSLLLGL